jgi:acyl-coenzyme A synthetase/AMP-(fatty) acid ligase
MSFLPLSDMFARGREPSHVVALVDGQPRDFRRFTEDIGAVTTRVTAQRHHRAALVCQGSYAFTVGLFGLLQAGCDIMLPPNGQAGTLESLRGHFDSIVDDSFVHGAEAQSTKLGPKAATANLTFFTSGSTGAPKKIVKTLAMLDGEIAALQDLWGDSSGHGTAFATVSHQHVYGMTFKILWPMAAGRPFADETDELWETALARLTPDATLVSGPAHLSRIGGLTPLPTARRPARIFSAGAPLSLAAASATADIFGCRPTEIFGSTETGAIATRQQTTDDQPWHLLPGMRMRLTDNGCLSLRAPWIGEGWFDTADVVDPVPGGFLFIGRADRIVKIEGKRISLPEIEQSLTRLQWITAAAVTVLQDVPIRLAAAVVLTDAGREHLAGLGNFRFGRVLRHALSETQEAAGMPRLWRFVDQLPPQDGMGKRREGDLRALFETTP